MTFSESIQTCLRDKYATFSGRASRSEYWWFILALMIFGIVITLVFSLLAGGFEALLLNPEGFLGSGAGLVFVGISGLLYLAILIPSIAVTVRRFHDKNLSGWWYLALILLGFVPFVGFLASIATLVICVLKGTEGPNKFGPDPLGGGEAEIFS